MIGHICDFNGDIRMRTFNKWFKSDARQNEANQKHVAPLKVHLSIKSNLRNSEKVIS